MTTSLCGGPKGGDYMARRRVALAGLQGLSDMNPARRCLNSLHTTQSRCATAKALCSWVMATHCSTSRRARQTYLRPGSASLDNLCKRMFGLLPRSTLPGHDALSTCLPFPPTSEIAAMGSAATVLAAVGTQLRNHGLASAAHEVVHGLSRVGILPPFASLDWTGGMRWRRKWLRLRLAFSAQVSLVAFPLTSKFGRIDAA
mmetsp:Transcript_22628/g.69074  ORF Transcript_22628/g.69074 Transcript_22628/m.69074 type:complete len:201 (+) Transcript_22628:1286-1888(+)